MLFFTRKRTGPKKLLASAAVLARSLRAIAGETTPDLSGYGFPHSWASDNGWFLTRPTGYSSIEKYPGSVYEDVASVEDCATLCSTIEYPGGTWNSNFNECFCEQQLDCIEPCLGEEETPGITFSAQPRSNFGYCEKSVCDYFPGPGGYGAWCEEVGFDQNRCTEKKLSNLGYPHSWTSDDGWFLLSPSDSVSLENKYENVTSVTECAQICSREVEHQGGFWGWDSKFCFCEQQIKCLEPCLKEEETPGIIFSTRPRSGFDYCEKSYCQYYAEDDGDWCEEVGFTLNGCMQLNVSGTGHYQGADKGGLGPFVKSAASDNQGANVAFGAFIFIIFLVPAALL